MNEVFVGVIVVAIVGNAAEHSTAVMVALKNKMDLAVGIAIGSALQIALFVAPVLVFASYLRAEPMDLLFTTLEVVAVILSVVLARMVAEDGESNWLEGLMLLMIYAILALAFFFLPTNGLRHGRRGRRDRGGLAPDGESITGWGIELSNRTRRLRFGVMRFSPSASRAILEARAIGRGRSAAQIGLDASDIPRLSPSPCPWVLPRLGSSRPRLRRGRGSGRSSCRRRGVGG